LVLALVSLRQAYGHYPAKELKLRSKAKDVTARQLYKAAIYGSSLQVVLWVLNALAVAWFFRFAVDSYGVLASLLIGALLILASFSWLPAHGPTAPGVWLAANLAPVFGWLMQYLHSPIAWTQSRLARYWPRHRHSGLFDKDDLVDLLTHQPRQKDNRIDPVELELTAKALAFGDKKVAKHMTPRRKAKSVGASDSIGPILMDELHASGQTRFPVYDGKKTNIVGTLFLRDLVNTKASAVARDVMRPTVNYVHEDQTLLDALQAILRTHHHLLIVVNDQQDYVGVLSIEDVLSQIIGEEIVDEFDQYDDRRAVASRGTKPARTEPAAEPDSSEAATEVIE
jgi:CBS domain containing-hemolysin-like protein